MSEKIAEPTAGTWQRNIKPAHKYPTVWAGRNTHVAYMATGLPPEEVEANICLVVSAKDMLAALKAAWAAYEPQYVSAMACDADRTNLDEAFDGVRAAIAQAEGRA